MTSAVAISGSPSRESKSRRLLAHALTRCAEAGLNTTLIDLCELPADDLLGRARSAAIADALAAVAGARIVIVGTPVYRASYSGMLKVFFDLFPMDALDGKVAIPIATGGGPAHQLVIDHALRPLLASVGAQVVATGIYAIDAQFGADGPQEIVTQRIDRAVAEALAISDLAAESSYTKR
jgi:FMN reductase